MKTLYFLGLFDSRPKEVGGKKIIPRDFFLAIAPPAPGPEKMMELVKNKVIEDAVLIMQVCAEGVKNGKNIRMRATIISPDLMAISDKMPGATYISYPTGLAAACFSLAIPKIKKRGVFPPENLDADIRRALLAALKKQGIKISGTGRGFLDALKFWRSAGGETGRRTTLRW